MLLIPVNLAIYHLQEDCYERILSLDFIILANEDIVCFQSLYFPLFFFFFFRRKKPLAGLSSELTCWFGLITLSHLIRWLIDEFRRSDLRG